MPVHLLLSNTPFDLQYRTEVSDSISIFSCQVTWINGLEDTLSKPY